MLILLSLLFSNEKVAEAGMRDAFEKEGSRKSSATDVMNISPSRLEADIS